MASRKEKLYSILCEVLQFDELSLCWIIADYEQSEFLNELDQMLSDFVCYEHCILKTYNFILENIHNALKQNERTFVYHEPVSCCLPAINKRLKHEHGIKIYVFRSGGGRIICF